MPRGVYDHKVSGTPREETLLGKERRLDELRERAEKAEAHVERLKRDLEAARVRNVRTAAGEWCSRCEGEIQDDQTTQQREAPPAPAATAGEEPAQDQAALHPDPLPTENAHADRSQR
jgi:hypothetical protein